jgi:hypothetical protein
MLYFTSFTAFVYYLDNGSTIKQRRRPNISRYAAWKQPVHNVESGSALS